VTAMLNRRFQRHYNKKRIYRLMRKAGRLLPRSHVVRPKHSGTGKVMVAHPNTRWASDCFEIHCWNDEKVYVTFAIDCCDREVIHFIATTEDIKAEVVQALIALNLAGLHRRSQKQGKSGGADENRIGTDVRANGRRSSPRRRETGDQRRRKATRSFGFRARGRGRGDTRRSEAGDRCG